MHMCTDLKIFLGTRHESCVRLCIYSDAIDLTYIIQLALVLVFSVLKFIFFIHRHMYDSTFLTDSINNSIVN